MSFKEPLSKTDLGPLMIHDSYLINMGSPDEGKGNRAQNAFLEEYHRCEDLGVGYLIFHPGSHTHPKKAMRDENAVRRLQSPVCQHNAECLQHRSMERLPPICRVYKYENRPIAHTFSSIHAV